MAPIRNFDDIFLEIAYNSKYNTALKTYNAKNLSIIGHLYQVLRLMSPKIIIIVLACVRTEITAKAS